MTKEYRVWAKGYPHGQGHYVIAKDLKSAIRSVAKQKNKHVRNFNGKLWKVFGENARYVGWGKK